MGPDSIYNEKTASVLNEKWTNQHNQCLKNTSELVLSHHSGSLQMQRWHLIWTISMCSLQDSLPERFYQKAHNCIPEEQFGFHKGRSTIHAMKFLRNSVDVALRHPKGKLRPIFVDYKKTFDLVNRERVIKNLKGMYESTLLQS